MHKEDGVSDKRKAGLLTDANNIFARYKNDGKYVHQELLRYLTDLFQDEVVDDDLRLSTRLGSEEWLDFSDIIEECKMDAPESFARVEMFADKAMSRATLFSALVDFAGRLTSITEGEENAEKIYEWLVGQEVLNASVVCEIIGATRFKNSLKKLIHSLPPSTVTDAELARELYETQASEGLADNQIKWERLSPEYINIYTKAMHRFRSHLSGVGSMPSEEGAVELLRDAKIALGWNETAQDEIDEVRERIAKYLKRIGK